MIAEFEERILTLIDEMVDSASDDELFAGGYLRGHLTLAVAEIASQRAPFTPASSLRPIRRWYTTYGRISTAGLSMKPEAGNPSRAQGRAGYIAP